jgi:sugar phosphate isomerase/epimerase
MTEFINVASRRAFIATALGLSAASRLPGAVTRRWHLGLNTYCLRFQRWNDRQMLDYTIKQRLDSMFLQDTQDPRAQDPEHWKEVGDWMRQAQMRIETGGGAILPANPGERPKVIAALRRNIERAKAMGSPIVRALVASDRYSMPPGPVEQHMETVIKLLREVRSQLMDAGLKIGLENHKELHAFQTRQVIESAGREFVGSYLDTGNPVFVCEDPLTTIEELGPYAVSFHLRDSVIYNHPEGIAIQWVPLGEGTNDFSRLLARAADLMPPEVHIYCKPITARPAVVLPVYSDEFWTKWFPHCRSKDLGRFLALAKRGKPYDQPHIMADLPGIRDRYMDALKLQQIAHMEQSLDYARKKLRLGHRAQTAA